jgi:hypothetical protein
VAGRFRRFATGRAAKTAGRRVPWIRIVMLGAEALPLLRRHWDKLTPAERHELADLIRRSRGRPGNLAPGERATIQALLRKLEPRPLLRDLARVARGKRRRG